jgi:hypothetical protein
VVSGIIMGGSILTRLLLARVTTGAIKLECCSAVSGPGGGSKGPNYVHLVVQSTFDFALRATLVSQSAA